MFSGFFHFLELQYVLDIKKFFQIQAFQAICLKTPWAYFQKYRFDV